jgi:predicted TPR repeat methyltransferase
MKPRRREHRHARRGSRAADLRAAIALHRGGDLDRAEQAYERLLAADPEHIEALHFLGVLQHQRGRSDRAIASIRRAIALAPDYADAHNNLGNVLKETNQLEAALEAYRRAVSVNPGHADAWNNLGVLLRGRGEFGEADQAYRRAIELNPSLAAAWHNRGNLLARLDRLDEAEAAYRRVVALRPGQITAYDALGKTLYRARKIDQAVGVYRQWLEADPESGIARHMLAACTGEAPPARASDAYVRDLFDGFAGSFDQVLDQLEYRAPALIRGVLQQRLPAPDAALVVADAGCGTGLCADFLRPYARRLVGIDLSPGMLARARARNIYDQLVEAELSAWLAGQSDPCDLIVCADTLCYFGALADAFSAAESALRPGGLLVFTVERSDNEVDAYTLHPSGRYSHADRYVRDRLAAAGMTLVGLERVVLRREGGFDVNSLLVSARRPEQGGVPAAGTDAGGQEHLQE